MGVNADLNGLFRSTLVVKLGYQAFLAFVSPEYIEKLRQQYGWVEIEIADVSNLAELLKVIGEVHSGHQRLQAHGLAFVIDLITEVIEGHRVEQPGLET